MIKLIAGNSRAIISANIMAMVKEGHPRGEAIEACYRWAIAHSNVGEKEVKQDVYVESETPKRKRGRPRKEIQAPQQEHRGADTGTVLPVAETAIPKGVYTGIRSPQWWAQRCAGSGQIKA